MGFPLALLTTPLLVAPPAPAEPPSALPNAASENRLQARARVVVWTGAGVTAAGTAVWAAGFARTRTLSGSLDEAAQRRARHWATGGAAAAAAGACVMAMGWVLWAQSPADADALTPAVSLGVSAQGPAVRVGLGGRF